MLAVFVVPTSLVAQSSTPPGGVDSMSGPLEDHPSRQDVNTLDKLLDYDENPQADTAAAEISRSDISTPGTTDLEASAAPVPELRHSQSISAEGQDLPGFRHEADALPSEMASTSGEDKAGNADGSLRRSVDGKGRDIRKAGATLRLHMQNTDDAWLAGGLVDVDGAVTDNPWVAGGRLDIDVAVGEDIWAAGGDVNLKGSASQDVHAAGGHVEAKNRVTGNLLLSGADIIIAADVGGDLRAAGAFIRVMPQSRIGRTTSLAGSHIYFNGEANNSVEITGDTVEFDGRIGGNLKVNARRLTINDTASIGGAFTYRGLSPASIAPGAVIKGKISQDIVSEGDFVRPDARRLGGGLVALGGAFLALGAFVFGGILYFLFPALVTRFVGMLRHRPARSLGWGFVVLFLTPVVAALLMFTVIGIPVGFVIFSLYPVLLFLGYVVAAFGFSDWLLNRRNALLSVWRFLIQFALGLIVLTLIVLVPFIGWWLFFAAFLVGIGAASLAVFSNWRSEPSPEGTSASGA
jgi:hypothetical protein